MTELPVRGPYQFLPGLDPEAESALRDSIATFGILQPVVTDEDGNILDGHHRKAIAAELGIECPTVILPGLTEPQKIEQALTLNLARRHLTRHERERLVHRLRSYRLSVRFISEQTGIPRSTVQRVLSGVPTGTTEYITGADGKRYAARHPDRALARWRATWAAAGAWAHAATGPEFRRWMETAYAEYPRWLEDLAAEWGVTPEERDPDWSEEQRAAIAAIHRHDSRPDRNPTPEDVRTGDDALWESLLLSSLLPAAGAALIRTGRHLPPPPWFLSRYPDDWRMRNALAEWDIRVEREAGRFLDWCEERGIRLGDKGWSFPENILNLDKGHWFGYMARWGDRDQWRSWAESVA